MQKTQTREAQHLRSL